MLAAGLFLLHCVRDPLALPTNSVQSFEIDPKAFVRLGTVLKALQIVFKFHGGLGGKAVNDPLTVACRLNHFLLPQICQMLGDLRLRYLQNVLKVTHTERTLREQVNDAKARGIAEALVDLNEIHGATFPQPILSVNAYMQIDRYIILRILDSMNVSEFKSYLASNPDKFVRFVFDDGETIPAHYHVTEVGHVKKDFIDCGGTVRSLSTCLLQTWTHDDDLDHRLDSSKLLSIISLAEGHFPITELEVEVEYEDCVISQFLVVGAEAQGDAVTFQLGDKHTDCLAKEKCGIDGSGCC